MSYNLDEMTPPVWMDKGFFEKVVKKSENNENIVIEDFTIRPGTKPGDHFASVMFGADIKYTTPKNNEISELSVIMKTLPSIEGIKKEFLAEGAIFLTEIKLYTKVLRQMERILEIANEQVKFGPELLYYATDPYMVIVFEDLSKYGYKMTPTLLNFEQAKPAYVKLAQFHATSIFMNDEGIEDLTLLEEGLFNEKTKDMMSIWMSNFTVLSDLLRTWPGYEIYGDKLDNVKEKIFDKVLSIYKSNKAGEGYNVLTHGDFHHKNMMFKNGNYNEVMLLDYQMSYWGSHSIDLIYSLYTLVTAETRENKRDEIIKFYHDEFAATLKKIGYLKKIPTLHELQMEILKNGYLEVLLVAIFLPFMMFDFAASENTIDLSTMDLNDTDKVLDMAKMFYEGPAYRDALKNMLPFYLHKGLFDL